MSPDSLVLEHRASNMDPAEWDARVQLAAAYRLVDHFGWTRRTTVIGIDGFPKPSCPSHGSGQGPPGTGSCALHPRRAADIGGALDPRVKPGDDKSLCRVDKFGASHSKVAVNGAVRTLPAYGLENVPSACSNAAPVRIPL
jgi:hypothetical protein